MRTLNEHIAFNECSKILMNDLLCHIDIDDWVSGFYDLYIHIIERHRNFENALYIGYHIFSELVDHIDDKVINVDISKSNSFINNVCISLSESKGDVSGRYDYMDNDTVFINLYINKKNLNEDCDNILKIIIYEMLHSYEDYQRINHNEKSISKLIDNRYNSAMNYLQYDDNKFIKHISRHVYLFNDQERNAYFSQLEIDIRNIIKKNNITLKQPQRYKIITDELSKLEIWKDYVELSLFIN